MAAHYVKCLYCGETFNRDKVKDCVQISSRRYAHLDCKLKMDKDKTKDERDLEALESYIKQLLSITEIDQRIRHQIETFHSKNNFSYSGIYKALMYFYEVKKNDIEKANGGIGIVPYVYQEAYNYYYHIWVANQSNEQKIIPQIKTQEEIVIISPPKSVPKKRKLFTFLDREDVT